MMPRSLRLLLTGIIDYAGIYPPAQLPFEESLRNYVDYADSPFHWLVGSFVCPVDKLAELKSREHEYAQLESLPIALIGRGGSSPEELLSHCNEDFEVFDALRSSQCEARSYEFRIPANLAAAESLGEALKRATAGCPASKVFCEIPIIELSRDQIDSAIRSVSITKRSFVKFRLGGVNAQAFPDTETLAGAIESAASADISVKFTAGLHHPFYHIDKVLDVRMHGFLNVFCAAVLAKAHGLESQTIEAILMETDRAEFCFDDDGMKVGNIEANIAQIESGRAFAVGFGSCSVMEPVEDLQNLSYTFQ
ncbi:MAG: hypothetical protein KIT74_03560 [Fimbriimonadales bacterium]|nr:hypothetical protein [Fimbriimonadales bacterium]